MKVCPRCQKTYSDDNLNFCLDDGTTLNFARNAADDSVPATVLLNQTRPTDPSPPSFGGQASQPGGWQPNGNQQQQQFSAAAAAPKKSKTWLWVLGILGAVVLLCGGSLTGFIAYVASLDTNSNRARNTNYSFNANYSTNSTAQRNSTPTVSTSVQTVDLSRWVKGDTDIGTTEFADGEFTMASKKKGYYYVLAAQAIYKTEDATTRVTVKNLDGDSSSLGFGLVIHSSPVPLTQDYAFLIDSESKKYRVVRHTPGDEIPVVGWTRSAAIKDGSAENVLEVRDENKKMNFYINGEFIKAFDNKDGYSGGVTGLYSGDGVRAAFSDLQISR